jgi:hypothetical protein
MRLTQVARQPAETVLGPVRGACGRVCTLGLLGVTLALVSLAGASPPDPVWIPGIYDDADFDEVVAAVLSTAGVVERPLLGLETSTLLIAGTVQLADAPLVSTVSGSTFSARAPPRFTLPTAA